MRAPCSKAYAKPTGSGFDLFAGGRRIGSIGPADHLGGGRGSYAVRDAAGRGIAIEPTARDAILRLLQPAGARPW